MRIEMPDVNLLLALLDRVHPHHQKASSWFARAAAYGWATCPLTENGFIRILSSPSYPGIRLSTIDAIALLDTTISNHTATHHFWSDEISLRDKMLFKHSEIRGHKQTTDIYLLGLCQQNGGTLVTLDAGITIAAIAAPHPELLRIL